MSAKIIVNHAEICESNAEELSRFFNRNKKNLTVVMSEEDDVIRLNFYNMEDKRAYYLPLLKKDE